MCCFLFVCFKITELLNDVERLKQALNGLSQLMYTTGVPSKRQSQQVEMLQSQVRTLQQQLAVSDCARGCLQCSSVAYSCLSNEETRVCSLGFTVNLDCKSRVFVILFYFFP